MHTPYRIRCWHFGDKMGAGFLSPELCEQNGKEVVTFSRKGISFLGEGVGLQWCLGLEESWTSVAWK
jgi:hypothetical protein